MATKNIVPRANGEGGIGTALKKWLAMYATTFYGNLTGNVTGDVTGTASGNVPNSVYDANSIVKADSDNTPVALTVAEQRLIGRKTGGPVDDLTADDVDSIVGFSPSVRQTVLSCKMPGVSSDLVRGASVRGNSVDFSSYGDNITTGLMGYLVKLVADNGYTYELTTPGITAASEGTGWPTTVGQTKTDGTCVWTCRSGLSCFIFAYPGVPAILTFADGFNATTGKPIDYTVVLTRCYTVTGITANSTRCVMALYDKTTGLLNNIIASEPIPEYGSPLTSAPVGSGLLGFDYQIFKQRIWGGASWSDYAYPTLYLGEVTTNASAVTSSVSYAPMGRYDSGLFAVAASTGYAKSDNLGCPGIVDVTIADDASGTNERPMAGYIGWFPYATNRNSMLIQTASNVGVNASNGGYVTSAYYRYRKQRCF